MRDGIRLTRRPADFLDRDDGSTSITASSIPSNAPRIDALYLCPHHPEAAHDSLRMHCQCRKPEPGMLLRAFEEWPVDRSGSFLIRDRQSDIEAAQAARIPGHLFDGSNLLVTVQRIAGATGF